MTDALRIKAVEPVLYGVVKIAWDDGYEGVVDVRPVIATGQMFAFLRADPKRFATVRLEEFGHYVYWLDDDGDEIEFEAESLRRRAEEQAELHRMAG